MATKKLVETGNVISNEELSADVNAMVLECPKVVELAQPGQFVMIKNEMGSTYLRRPFGVADVDKEKGLLLLIYRKAGKGTNELSMLEEGAPISVEGPLGNGFSFDNDGRTLLVGGGVGIAPIIYTARKLGAEMAGPKPIILLGVRNHKELFWSDFLEDFSQKLVYTTDDGSYGRKGFAIDAIPDILKAYPDIKHIKVCGPTIMMKGIAELAIKQGLECEVSLEKRMACGFGVCLGCTFEGKSGKRWKVCGDGPVFDAEEVFG
ncbi:MAG: dihydroorotate dehydrogenase electron transfer subunit [Anaerovibrio sp.]|uniref:dihydroorotate dehydrogenase electron transfer subunit n=1 Tax=Anaerovibrio sp. TaxID=1872532 RepID=UPI0025CC2C43|nr:dihydroorotate dehydrogenase electron transfer subunit [Anaerovibrio sp.]MCR5176257.1 dihydroorotate dehydrogenase electron transfer subunit [Anaerovibrio sp.]